MSIKDALLPEFDQEMATTRKVLERVPLSDADWKPHEKSMSLGELAAHIVETPGWALATLNQPFFDMASMGDYQRPVFTDTKGLLSAFDEAVAKARESIASKNDEEMMQMWSLKKEGQDLLTLPKLGVLRSFVMNHLIHHRGQMSVYIRLKNVPVPSIYGSSADEEGL